MLLDESREKKSRRRRAKQKPAGSKPPRADPGQALGRRHTWFEPTASAQQPPEELPMLHPFHRWTD